MVWKKLTKEELEEIKVEYAHMGYVGQWTAMAWAVIITTLGPDWWEKHWETARTSKDYFLKLGKEYSREDHIFQHRMIILGHMLYALKDAQGYETFISSLKTGDIESTFFELLVAELLQRNGFSIEFIAESGKKTEDYDVRANINDSEFCVEAKSRRDGIILNEKTLTNTLQKARKQLPSTLPGIIFISIPEQWTREPTVENIIGECVKAFLRNTGRVNYVVIVWNIHVDLEVGKVSALLFRDYKNENPRNPVSLENIINSIKLPTVIDFENQEWKPSFW